jgi:hypothetical protein
MNKTLLGLAVLPFMAATAWAAQPLTDKQMDNVVAGHVLSEVDITDVSYVQVAIGEAAASVPTTVTNVQVVSLPLTTITIIWGTIP